ncbi:hypothetical protein ACX0G9_30785 [Flavitalea flava]
MQKVIHFLNGNNILMEDHYMQKGYRDDIIVEIDKLFYEVYFFSEGVLKYEMTNDGYFSLPGIIIIDEVNTKGIINAINILIEMKYFESFKGKEEIPLNSRFLQKWHQVIGPEFTLETLSSFALD